MLKMCYEKKPRRKRKKWGEKEIDPNSCFSNIRFRSKGNCAIGAQLHQI